MPNWKPSWWSTRQAKWQPCLPWWLTRHPRWACWGNFRIGLIWLGGRSQRTGSFKTFWFTMIPRIFKLMGTSTYQRGQSCLPLSNSNNCSWIVRVSPLLPLQFRIIHQDRTHIRWCFLIRAVTIQHQMLANWNLVDHRKDRSVCSIIVSLRSCKVPVEMWSPCFRVRTASTTTTNTSRTSQPPSSISQSKFLRVAHSIRERWCRSRY